MSETWRDAWHRLSILDSWETVDAFEAGWNAREDAIKAPILIPFELARVALGAAEFIRDEHGPDGMVTELIDYLEGLGISTKAAP